MSRFVGVTARSYFSVSGLLFTDNFQIMTLQGGDSAVSLCAALNSTFFQLVFYTEARANYTEGVRSIQTYETAKLPTVKPSLLGELDATMFTSSDWDVLNPSAERREIDTLAFDAIRLTQGERDAIYQAVSELMGNRMTRAVRMTVVDPTVRTTKRPS